MDSENVCGMLGHSSTRLTLHTYANIIIAAAQKEAAQSRDMCWDGKFMNGPTYRSWRGGQIVIPIPGCKAVKMSCKIHLSQCCQKVCLSGKRHCFCGHIYFSLQAVSMRVSAIFAIQDQTTLIIAVCSLE